VAVLGVIEPKDEDTTILPNIRDYLPNNRAPRGGLKSLRHRCFWEQQFPWPRAYVHCCLLSGSCSKSADKRNRQLTR